MEIIEWEIFCCWLSQLKYIKFRKILHKLEQNDDSVEIYFHKLKYLWDENVALDLLAVCTYNGCTCGITKAHEEKEQTRRVMHFLMGLHESFTNAWGQILMMHPLLSVTQAYSLIKQEEKQRQGYVSILVNSSVACVNQ